MLADVERVAALDVGWVSAATEADIVDLAGLTDPEVATLPGGHTSKRVDARFLLAREPDTLLVYAPFGPPSGGLESWQNTITSRAVEAHLLSDDVIARHFGPSAWLALGSSERATSCCGRGEEAGQRQRPRMARSVLRGSRAESPGTLTDERGKSRADAVTPAAPWACRGTFHASTRDLFALVFDEAPRGMVLLAIDGRVLRVNRAACEILGHAVEEMEKLVFDALVLPDDLDADHGLAQRLLGGEIHSYQTEKRCVRRDGTMIHALLAFSLVRDPDGHPQYRIAEIDDVTERAASEAAIRASEAGLRDLVELAPDGIFIADLEGHYTWVNAAASTLTGYTRGELLDMSIVDLIPSERGEALVSRGDAAPHTTGPSAPSGLGPAAEAKRCPWRSAAKSCPTVAGKPSSGTSPTASASSTSARTRSSGCGPSSSSVPSGSRW